jgi:hypothetical protein
MSQRYRKLYCICMCITSKGFYVHIIILLKHTPYDITLTNIIQFGRGAKLGPKRTLKQMVRCFPRCHAWYSKTKKSSMLFPLVKNTK